MFGKVGHIQMVYQRKIAHLENLETLKNFLCWNLLILIHSDSDSDYIDIGINAVNARAALLKFLNSCFCCQLIFHDTRVTDHVQYRIWSSAFYCLINFIQLKSRDFLTWVSTLSVNGNVQWKARCVGVLREDEGGRARMHILWTQFTCSRMTAPTGLQWHFTPYVRLPCIQSTT